MEKSREVDFTSGGEISPTEKDSSEFRGSMSPASSESSHMSPSQLKRTPFFPSQHLDFNSGHPKKVGVYLALQFSHSQDGSAFDFLNFSSGTAENKGLLEGQGTHINS